MAARRGHPSAANTGGFMLRIRPTLLVVALAAAGACSSGEPAVSMDDALRNDLALAATVRSTASPYVSPMELGQYPPQGYAPAGYGPAGYAPQPYPPQYQQPYYQPVYAPAPAPARARTTTASRSSAGTSSGAS